MKTATREAPTVWTELKITPLKVLQILEDLEDVLTVKTCRKERENGNDIDEAPSGTFGSYLGSKVREVGSLEVKD